MAEKNLSAFIWSVADLLRGDFKKSDYGRVILPFTVLRRLECVLFTRNQIDAIEERAFEDVSEFKNKINRKNYIKILSTNNYKKMSLILGYKENAHESLISNLNCFTSEIKEIFECFDFINQIKALNRANILCLMLQKFSDLDLHPKNLSNFEMGLVFEELIRKFAESSNENSGEHFTPREVINLMVKLLFINDYEAKNNSDITRSIYDPTAGTGGMLSVSEEYLRKLNPLSFLDIHGQELNPESYAICKADMLLKGNDITNITLGNTISNDKNPNQKYDYMLSNPPFGVDWKKVKECVIEEHKVKGFEGRFGAGLPRVSDGSLLFLMHLVSKMKPINEGGSRIGIVLSGSPLFTGSAGSGESEIRRYLFENDLIECIISLPIDLFYNTGINTYIWIITNKKFDSRKGKIQLIDASNFWIKMRKSLGSKRKKLSDLDIINIIDILNNFKETVVEGKSVSKIYNNNYFGYQTITIEHPLRDNKGNIILGKRGKLKGKPIADIKLRDSENIRITEDPYQYFISEIQPNFPDSWIDQTKIKIGYEIAFQKEFYVFKKQRSLDEIDADLKIVGDEIIEIISNL